MASAEVSKPTGLPFKYVYCKEELADEETQYCFSCQKQSSWDSYIQHEQVFGDEHMIIVQNPADADFDDIGLNLNVVKACRQGCGVFRSVRPGSFCIRCEKTVNEICLVTTEEAMCANCLN